MAWPFSGGLVSQLLARCIKYDLPPDHEVKQLLGQAASHFANLPSLVEANVPAGATLHVIGDIHGQFEELISVLRICGPPAAGRNILLFNGDFVDRGHRSAEVMLVICALALEAKDAVFLNRGNHETRAMNRAYGFEEEAILKYSKSVYESFQAVFVQLPLATLVNQSVLVVHGGLPAADGVKLSDIAAVQRGGDLLVGVAHDLLWADPTDVDGLHPSPRGGGIRLFGPDVTARFCDDNDLLCCIRSHEVAMGGYAWQRGGRCVTVFSAANYVGRVGNLGAVCHIRPPSGGRIKPGDLSFTTFEGHAELRPSWPPAPRSRL
mmetsp:Transcript_114984/g.330256  ORF Transcript_114984/g.330256 Transcript_114984/m.330256 type:complete len:321 (+) Transcript_114984:59-1021(+)